MLFVVLVAIGFQVHVCTYNIGSVIGDICTLVHIGISYIGASLHVPVSEDLLVS